MRDQGSDGLFCVECGKDVEADEELRGGLCVDCFLERNPVLQLPQVVDLVRCPLCGAIHGRGGWGPATDLEAGDDEDDLAMQRAVARAAEEALTVVEGALVMSVATGVRREMRSAFTVEVEAELGFMGQVVPVRMSTRVRVRGETCPACSRLAGQYYEAVIQLRGTRERPPTPAELERAQSHVEDEIRRLATISRDVNLVKEEEMHGGIDFYISAQSAAAQIAKGLRGIFSASSSTSTTLVGRRDGKDVVRVTHAVRLPDLRRGDYVMLRGQVLRVVSATAKEATVDVAAGEGKRRHLSRDDRTDLALVGDSASVEEAVLVSTSAGEVQVLDPQTLRTVDIVLPPGYAPAGRETVRVVRAGDQLFLVD